MKELRQESVIRIYEKPEEAPAHFRRLLAQAREAMQQAYAPYSAFSVGAAVLLDDGTVVLGSNQENASYPQGLCAERVALFAAGANHPDKTPLAIALYTSQLEDGPVSPCGGCRQVMVECEARYGSPMALILTNREGHIGVMDSVSGLLPWAFDGRILLRQV